MHIFVSETGGQTTNAPRHQWGIIRYVPSIRLTFSLAAPIFGCDETALRARFSHSPTLRIILVSQILLIGRNPHCVRNWSLHQKKLNLLVRESKNRGLPQGCATVILARHWYRVASYRSLSVKSRQVRETSITWRILP